MRREQLTKIVNEIVSRADLLLPAALALGLASALAGGLVPGGGVLGAVVVSGAVILVYLKHGSGEVRRWLDKRLGSRTMEAVLGLAASGAGLALVLWLAVWALAPELSQNHGLLTQMCGNAGLMAALLALVFSGLNVFAGKGGGPC